MNRENLKETIRQELPEILRLDPEFRSCILEITRDTYVDRKEAQNWFYEMLDEMRRERERQDNKWERHLGEEAKKWDKHTEEETKKWQKHLQEQKEYQAKDDAKWQKHLQEQKEYQAKDDAKWQKHTQEHKEYQAKDDAKWARWQEQWKEQNRSNRKGFILADLRSLVDQGVWKLNVLRDELNGLVRKILVN